MSNPNLAWAVEDIKSEAHLIRIANSHMSLHRSNDDIRKNNNKEIKQLEYVLTLIEADGNNYTGE